MPKRSSVVPADALESMSVMLATSATSDGEILPSLENDEPMDPPSRPMSLFARLSLLCARTYFIDVVCAGPPFFFLLIWMSPISSFMCASSSFWSSGMTLLSST